MHSCKGENFLEIGCDYGYTVYRVQKGLLNETETENNEEDAEKHMDEKVVALGIDKAEESIDIAKKRYVSNIFLCFHLLCIIEMISISSHFLLLNVATESHLILMIQPHFPIQLK